jgi:hypothetical protein
MSNRHVKYIAIDPRALAKNATYTTFVWFDHRPEFGQLTDLCEPARWRLRLQLHLARVNGGGGGGLDSDTYEDSRMYLIRVVQQLERYAVYCARFNALVPPANFVPANMQMRAVLSGRVRDDVSHDHLAEPLADWARQLAQHIYWLLGVRELARQVLTQPRPTDMYCGYSTLTSAVRHLVGAVFPCFVRALWEKWHARRDDLVVGLGAGDGFWPLELRRGVLCACTLGAWIWNDELSRHVADKVEQNAIHTYDTYMKRTGIRTWGALYELSCRTVDHSDPLVVSTAQRLDALMENARGLPLLPSMPSLMPFAREPVTAANDNADGADTYPWSATPHGCWWAKRDAECSTQERIARASMPWNMTVNAPEVNVAWNDMSPVAFHVFLQRMWRLQDTLVYTPLLDFFCSTVIVTTVGRFFDQLSTRVEQWRPLCARYGVPNMWVDDAQWSADVIAEWERVLLHWTRTTRFRYALSSRAAWTAHLDQRRASSFSSPLPSQPSYRRPWMTKQHASGWLIHTLRFLHDHKMRVTATDVLQDAFSSASLSYLLQPGDVERFVQCSGEGVVGMHRPVDVLTRLQPTEQPIMTALQFGQWASLFTTIHACLPLPAIVDYMDQLSAQQNKVGHLDLVVDTRLKLRVARLTWPALLRECLYMDRLQQIGVIDASSASSSLSHGNTDNGAFKELTTLEQRLARLVLASKKKGRALDEVRSRIPQEIDAASASASKGVGSHTQSRPTGDEHDDDDAAAAAFEERLRVQRTQSLGSADRTITELETDLKALNREILQARTRLEEQLQQLVRRDAAAVRASRSRTGGGAAAVVGANNNNNNNNNRFAPGTNVYFDAHFHVINNALRCYEKRDDILNGTAKFRDMRGAQQPIGFTQYFYGELRARHRVERMAKQSITMPDIVFVRGEYWVFHGADTFATTRSLEAAVYLYCELVRFHVPDDHRVPQMFDPFSRNLVVSV